MPTRLKFEPRWADSELMRFAFIIFISFVLASCVQQEADHKAQSAERSSTGGCIQDSVGQLVRTPVFDSLPCELRANLLRQLDGKMDWERVTDIGFDHLERKIRAIEPCRSAWSSVNVALMADETPLGLLDVSSIQAGYPHEYELLVCGQSRTFLSVVPIRIWHRSVGLHSQRISCNAKRRHIGPFSPCLGAPQRLGLSK
ncbi:hypothetical protein PLCT2_01203 [Planctomycetaceae bacterium]|nr:hypothetical protein PLCT2_01203 [Planctomycetaceae bacterium]